jgi:hypothetical protein
MQTSVRMMYLLQVEIMKDKSDNTMGDHVRESFVRRLVSCRGIAISSLAAAALLFLFNIVGVMIPLRHADIYHEPNNIFTNDLTLTAAEFRKRVPRQPGEAAPNYARRMTETVADGIAHIQEADRATLQKYRWEIPIWENYLIWASRHGVQLQRWMRGTLAERGTAYKYQFSDWRRSVERGVGLCPTHAFVLTDILQAAGIRNQAVNIGHHVLNRAEIEPGKWWMLDPDYGVIVPHDLDALRENTHLMEPYYTARGHGAWLDQLRDWYADPNPRFYESVREAQGSGRYYFEFVSYYLVWIIPVILLMIGVASLRRGAANKHSSASSSGGLAGAHASIVSGRNGGIHQNVCGGDLTCGG